MHSMLQHDTGSNADATTFRCIHESNISSNVLSQPSAYFVYNEIIYRVLFSNVFLYRPDDWRAYGDRLPLDKRPQYYCFALNTIVSNASVFPFKTMVLFLACVGDTLHETLSCLNIQYTICTGVTIV